ncbi:hypothetical protein [Pseudoruegeria sp. SK021]|uniref:hypothetical protein n=1 Tax=Pseudoruegeria sp. SK021 TaxID=1933035 RepID=UPI000A254167|nr:hypothetical protein [Pseudoruegeria sp. SK021]OSP56246.1 hypothetical protein BV911_02845 [Pseudoruegeria sp. SK021]
MPDTRAPWHHWPIAILTLAFYLIGALDFTFTYFRLGFYTDNFSPEQVSYIRGLPSWVNGVWAAGVWGGLLGGWLLFQRNRFSVLLLFLGFCVMAFLTVWLSLFARPSLVGIAGWLGLYVMVGTTAVALLFYIYARWERSVNKL